MAGGPLCQEIFLYSRCDSFISQEIFLYSRCQFLYKPLGSGGRPGSRGPFQSEMDFLVQKHQQNKCFPALEFCCARRAEMTMKHNVFAIKIQDFQSFSYKIVNVFVNKLFASRFCESGVPAGPGRASRAREIFLYSRWRFYYRTLAFSGFAEKFYYTAVGPIFI